MKIIYQKYDRGVDWGEDVEPHLEMSDVSGLPGDELVELLGKVLDALRDRKAIDVAKPIITDKTGMVDKIDTNLLDGLKLTTDEFFQFDPKTNSMTPIKLNQTVPKDLLSNLKDGAPLFVSVETPEHINNQIRVLKREEEKRNTLLKRKKLKSKLESVRRQLEHLDK